MMLLSRSVVDPVMRPGRRSSHGRDRQFGGRLGGYDRRYLKARISIRAVFIAVRGRIADDLCTPWANKANSFDPVAKIGTAPERKAHHRPTLRQSKRRRRGSDLHQGRLFCLQVAPRTPVQIQRQSADDRPGYGTEIVPFHLFQARPVANRRSQKGTI